ncbi:MAG: DUF1273 domain-containing protein [Alistipes sp.]|nr:DUF1273 domain-containing protein [Alistipes sp.]
MIRDTSATVAFTGHRTYRSEADAALRRKIGELHAAGCRTFLSGMAAGFDLAAAEAVIACRSRLPGLRLVAAVPFEGHINRFSCEDQERFRRIMAAADETVVLSECYHRGVYMVRNDYLVSRAARVVAWFDGSPGGTRYTVQQALRSGRQVDNLCPTGPLFPPPAPTLF